MPVSPHSSDFLTHPLIFIAAAFMIGIVSSEFLLIPFGILICLAALISLASLMCVMQRRLVLASALVCLTFMLMGATLAALEQHVPADGLSLLLDQGFIREGEPVELIGVLERQPEAAPESFYLSLRVEKVILNSTEQRVSGEVSLLLPVSGSVAEAQYEKLDLRYGARLRAIATLRRADQYRNPGASSFTDFLEQRGLAATGVVKSPLLIERLGDDQVLLPLALLYRWRQRLQRQISTNFSPEAAGILNASLLGNRYFLSRASSERFREGGTFHVLVISGLHITFIGSIVLLLVQKLSKRRLTRFLMSAFVVWSYSFGVGAEASVVRAALMFTFVAFAPVVARRSASLNALGAAALLLLAIRPRDLFDPSFQLTFLSVAAIVVFGWPLLQRMSEIGSWRPTRSNPYPPRCSRSLRVCSEALFWKEKEWRRELSELNYRYRPFKTPLACILERWHLQSLLRYAFGAVLISFCVQLTMLPLLVVYFHRFSISGLILNIGVSVVMAVLIFVALVALIIAEASTSAMSPFIGLTNLLQWLMTHGVDPFTNLGIASVRLPEYSGDAAVLYGAFFLPLLVLAALLPRWRPLNRTSELGSRFRCVVRIAIGGQLVLAALMFHPFSAAADSKKLQIDFLDVGQGDAALVTLPDGTTLMIDGGGRPKFAQKKASETEKPFERDTRSIGEAVVSEYLWWRGLNQVDYLLATHADADHMEGLNDIARNFKIRAVLVARTPANDPEFAELAETLRRQGIAVQLIGSGDTLSFGAVSATVLWPTPSDSTQARSSNNDSLVLRMDYGSRRFLFLADIERQAELALVSIVNQNELTADVVKVAHHGSRTSSIPEFVKAVHPELAVISVGRRSMFGHPHKEVVQRWLAVGAQTLTTGESGTITVTTDGEDITVETFLDQRGN